MKLKNSLLCLFTIALISCESDNPDINKNTIVGNGKFSISSTKKVTFSKGALQYNATAKKWRFAANQYDMIGWNPSADSIKLDNGFADVFIKNDYKNIDIKTVVGEDWIELNLFQWHYVLQERENAKNLFGAASIEIGDANYIYGMLLLPDEWKSPQSISFNSSIINIYSLKEFKLIEKSGAVFFPFIGSPNFATSAGHGGHGFKCYPNDGAAYWSYPSALRIGFGFNKFYADLLEYYAFIEEGADIIVSEDSYAAFRLAKLSD